MERELVEVVERGDIRSLTRFLDFGFDINKRCIEVYVVSYNVCIGC